MYMRVVRGQTRPGQAEELSRRWREFVLPRLQGAPGFRHVHFGVDREADATIWVSVWESRPDEADMDRMLEEFRAQVGDLVAGAPTVEEYEVVVDA